MRREQDGAIITQFDMGACESLGLLKMDFLGLRNLTVLDDCLLNIEANRGEDVVLEDLAAGRPGDVRAAGPRRHARRLPARRRADAGAAALDAADRLRRHLRRARALPARSDGRQRAQRLRRPQERPQAGRADPPRAGRAAGRDPGRDLRADRLPGAGHGDRAEGRRLLARQGRPAAPGDGQEEEGDPRQGVRPVLRRDAGAAATPTARSRRCGTSWSRSPTTRSTRRTPRATAWCRTGRRTSRPTTRPSTWPRCSPRSRTTRTRARSTSTSAAGMGIKVLPPDVNDSDANFTPVGTDIRFGLSAIRNVGDNVVDVDRGRPARPRARSPTSPTSSARSSRSPATSGSSSR